MRQTFCPATRAWVPEPAWHIVATMLAFVKCVLVSQCLALNLMLGSIIQHHLHAFASPHLSCTHHIWSYTCASRVDLQSKTIGKLRASQQAGSNCLAGRYPLRSVMSCQARPQDDCDPASAGGGHEGVGSAVPLSGPARVSPIVHSRLQQVLHQHPFRAVCGTPAS